ncbi:MAG TPA: hypothetical protein VLA02_08655 [Reyranella sp.]|nr:hypothetical protein [Reyranella sp.]
MDLFIRGNLRSLLVAVFSCTFAVAEADADQGCGQFVLSPNGKVDLFAGYVPAFESGDILPTPGTFALRLKPAVRVIYPYKSDHDHNSGYGGVVAIESIRPGRHRIALSGEAQVDAAQGDSLLRLLAVARDPECPGVHSSVEIVSEGGALTVQISGARMSLITIAVFRVSMAGAHRPIRFTASSAFGAAGGRQSGNTAPLSSLPHQMS